jgi:hypothetical protein
MIHAWQVDRGDFVGSLWKGTDLRHLPYNVQPWELEAHGHQNEIAQSLELDLQESMTLGLRSLLKRIKSLK